MSPIDQLLNGPADRALGTGHETDLLLVVANDGGGPYPVKGIVEVVDARLGLPPMIDAEDVSTHWIRVRRELLADFVGERIAEIRDPDTEQTYRVMKPLDDPTDARVVFKCVLA